MIKPCLWYVTADETEKRVFCMLSINGQLDRKHLPKGRLVTLKGTPVGINICLKSTATVQ